MKRKRLILTIVVLVCMSALVVHRDRIWFFLVTRPPTADEKRDKFGDSALRLSGHIHRWKRDDDGGVLWYGTIRFYYGDSGVMSYRSWSELDGLRSRVTWWFPDGRVAFQRRGWRERDETQWEFNEAPPWWWGVQGQKSTKDLRGASFSGGTRILDGLDLRGADFSGARFWAATFRGTDVQNANFKGAEFRDSSDLSGAKNLTVQQILEAKFWNLDGFSPSKFPKPIEEALTRQGMRSRDQRSGSD